MNGAYTDVTLQAEYFYLLPSPFLKQCFPPFPGNGWFFKDPQWEEIWREGCLASFPLPVGCSPGQPQCEIPGGKRMHTGCEKSRECRPEGWFTEHMLQVCKPGGSKWECGCKRYRFGKTSEYCRRLMSWFKLKSVWCLWMLLHFFKRSLPNFPLRKKESVKLCQRDFGDISVNRPKVHPTMTA